MEILDRQKRVSKGIPRTFTIEILAVICGIIALGFMVWSMLSPYDRIPVLIGCTLIFTVCVLTFLYLLLNPDTVRARQTDEMLRLSSQMVDISATGIDEDSAQQICELLLPTTPAIAVAITDRKMILGYAGYMEAENPQGALIRTQATHDTINEGKSRVIYNNEEIGFPWGPGRIKGAIIVPLKVGKQIFGTLKFYYRSPRMITETQKSIVLGFGELLSTQIAASQLEEQRELATKMELKMLQNQINPHFLFNTINTIASLIRTDPMKARTLLRDFAVFYRSTLENSQDRIHLSLELDQVQRYFSFEVARFGEDRLEMIVDVEEDSDIGRMLVPPFLIQPLVENAVKHAMPAEGKLTVHIWADIHTNDVHVYVGDNGVGMDEEARNSIMHPHSSTGLGIAVKNVHDRLFGYYGENAAMIVDSTPGEGTTITLKFPDMALEIGGRDEQVGPGPSDELKGDGIDGNAEEEGEDGVRIVEMLTSELAEVDDDVDGSDDDDIDDGDDYDEDDDGDDPRRTR